jgi:hypothetical protein
MPDNDSTLEPAHRVTMDEARQLVQTAIENERISADLEAIRDQKKAEWNAAHDDASAAIATAAKSWSIARLALRAHARRQPMPENAGEMQLSLSKPDVVIPPDAKAGDHLHDTATDRWYVLKADGDGDLYAFQVEGYRHA